MGLVHTHTVFYKNGEDKEAKYQFTEEQYNQSEQLAVRQILDTVKSTKSNPTAIVIAAQPGAGKTGLAKHCMINFMDRSGQEIVEIDPDVVGMYHPYYEEIMKKDKSDAFHYIAQFSNRAMRTVNAVAIKRRNNILTQGTFRDTDGYMRILQSLKENEYNIDINLLAVNDFESFISCMERYFQFLEAGINPRVVSVVPHEEAYKKMIETVKRIEQMEITSNIKVFRRGKEEFEPQLVYSKGDIKYPSAVVALMEERGKDRKILFSHPEKFEERLRSLRDNISIYGSGMELLELWQYAKKEFEKVMTREREED